MIYYAAWVLISILYTPILFQLYQSRWEAIDYTHAYFILPVSLWMAWRKKTLLLDLFKKFVPQTMDFIGLVPVAIGLFMFVFGWRQEFLIISTLSMIPVVWGMIRYMYGSAIVKALTLPIFYLLFLVPPPLGLLDSLTLPMRYGISSAVEQFLLTFNYPVTKDGLLLFMDGHEIFVAAPCSGFRSLVTMLALTVAYVSFTKGSISKKILLTFSGIPFAILGNMIRVIALCLVTFYAGREKAEGFFHDFSGAAIFLIMICCLMGFEYILDRVQKRQDGAS